MIRLSVAARIATLSLEHAPVNAISAAWLERFNEHLDAADGPDDMLAYVAGIQRLYCRLESLPQVTLVEINGAAAAGGGYLDELEHTRRLLTDPQTRRRVAAFLAGEPEHTNRHQESHHET